MVGATATFLKTTRLEKDQEKIRRLHTLAPGEMYTYHEGIDLANCSKEVKETALALSEINKIRLFHKRSEKPNIHSIGRFEYIAQGVK